MEPVIYIAPLFFLAALIYSSVGFGGGSTYLALLVLFSFPYEQIPKIALILNLVVVSGGLIHYSRHQHLSFKRTLPLIVTSVPLAYLGGTIPVSENVFLGLLGFALAVAGLRLLFFFNATRDTDDGRTDRLAPTAGLIIGVPLGFVSGLTGLGGGIFLAPLLYLLRWGNGRAIAATSCFFIFVNSLSGLIGQFSKNGGAQFIEPPELIVSLMLAVFLGGQIGSHLSVGKLPLTTLQRTTAVLILMVAGRIFWGMTS